MDNQVKASSVSDLAILLYDMVYIQKLSDEAILVRLPQFQTKVLQDRILGHLAFVKDNPKCFNCNMLLIHFSGDTFFSERLYCPACNQQFSMDFPYEPILGGE
jgi:uncharacterized protein with PIN domain